MSSEAVSILLPVKNGLTTLPWAIRSILYNLGAEDELLVFNDGSTDGTDVFLSSFTDTRLKVVTQESSVGVANALNVLLDRARNPLVGRMDADDIALPWRIQAQKQAIRNGDDVVFTTRVNFGPTPLSYRPILQGPIASHEAPLMFVLENPVPHSSMLAKKSVVAQYRGYKEGPAEDYELWMRMLADGRRFRQLNTPGILYRMHPDQVTRSSSWRQRYAKDVHLEAAHAHLVASIGWTGPKLWKYLHDDGPVEDIVIDFANFVLDKSKNISAFSQYRMRRACNSILRRFRSQREQRCE